MMCSLFVRDSIAQVANYELADRDTTFNSKADLALSIGLIYSDVHFRELYDQSDYYYDLLPVWGANIQFAFNYPIKKIIGLNTAIGYNRYGFEGRHFSKAVDSSYAINTNSLSAKTQEFWETIHCNNITLSTGITIHAQRIIALTANVKGMMRLNTRNAMREVWHNPTSYTSIGPSQVNHVNRFKRFVWGTEIFLTHWLTNDLSLGIGVFHSFSSLTNWRKDQYLLKPRYLVFQFNYSVLN